MSYPNEKRAGTQHAGVREANFSIKNLNKSIQCLNIYSSQFLWRFDYVFAAQVFMALFNKTGIASFALKVRKLFSPF